MKIHLFNTAHNDFVKTLNAMYLCKKQYSSKSYTKGAMALCVSNYVKMGVDIEEKKQRSQVTMEHFIKRFATFQINNPPVHVDSSWFYKAWTAMESYFKLAGKGFGTSKDFVLDLEQQAIWQKGKRVAWLQHFDIDNIIICLCSDTYFFKQDVRIIYHGWED